jgi:hypothetical protein
MQVQRTLWILLGAILLLAAPAGADDAASELRHRKGADLIAHMDRDPLAAGWLASQLDRVRVHKRRGFAYTAAFGEGEDGIELSVQGPVVGKKKAVGLGFEVRF